MKNIAGILLTAIAALSLVGCAPVKKPSEPVEVVVSSALPGKNHCWVYVNAEDEDNTFYGVYVWEYWTCFTYTPGSRYIYDGTNLEPVTE